MKSSFTAAFRVVNVSKDVGRHERVLEMIPVAAELYVGCTEHPIMRSAMTMVPTDLPAFDCMVAWAKRFDP